MHEHTEFTQNMDTLFSDLQNFTKTESVLGNPLTVGDKTLVPVMSVTLGYGSAGMGTKVEQTASNASNGIGLGAKISTSAVVVVEKNGVSMLPVSEKGNMGQLIDKVPQVFASLSQGANTLSGMQGQQNPLQGVAQGMTGAQQGSSQNQSQNNQSNQNNQNKQNK